MDFHVFDTYVKAQDGHTMHFDVVMDKNEIEKAISFAKEWLKSIGEGSVVSGFPAIDHKTNLRQLMGQRRLPQALRTIRDLEKRIEELEKKLNG